MIKAAMESPNLEFKVAVKYLVEKEWKGRQKILADRANISLPFLSQIKSGKKVASAKVQHQISNALNKTYEEVLALGRALGDSKTSSQFASQNAVENQINSNNVELVQNETNHMGLKLLLLEHKNIIESFKDKQTAYQINKKLLEIETKDPQSFEKIKNIIDLFYEDIRKRKKTAVNDSK